MSSGSPCTEGEGLLLPLQNPATHTMGLAGRRLQSGPGSSRFYCSLDVFSPLELPGSPGVLASWREQSHTTGFRVNTGYHETPDQTAKALATQPRLEIQPRFPSRPANQKAKKREPQQIEQWGLLSAPGVHSPARRKPEASPAICECWH